MSFLFIMIVLLLLLLFVVLIFIGWISDVHRSRSQVTLNCLAKSETEIEMLLCGGGRRSLLFRCICVLCVCTTKTHTQNFEIRFGCVEAGKEHATEKIVERRAMIWSKTECRRIQQQQQQKRREKNWRTEKRINIQNQQQQKLCMYIRQMEWREPMCVTTREQEANRTERETIHYRHDNDIHSNDGGLRMCYSDACIFLFIWFFVLFVV